MSIKLVKDYPGYTVISDDDGYDKEIGGIIRDNGKYYFVPREPHDVYTDKELEELLEEINKLKGKEKCRKMTEQCRKLP